MLTSWRRGSDLISGLISCLISFFIGVLLTGEGVGGCCGGRSSIQHSHSVLEKERGWRGLIHSLCYLVEALVNWPLLDSEKER